jgi:hypothetical protein
MSGIFFENSASLPLREVTLAVGEVYLNVTQNPSIILLSHLKLFHLQPLFPSFEAYRICYKGVIAFLFEFAQRTNQLLSPILMSI